MTKGQLDKNVNEAQELLVPAYLRAAVPNPKSNRAPWFKNIAPTYAGIFLSVVFYVQLAAGTLNQAGVGMCVLGLIVSAALCWMLYYYTPAMLGMQAGQPFYVVCTSTFGAKGGYLPGFLLGALNVGFFGVVTFAATSFITLGLHIQSKTLFAAIAIVWGYVIAFVAMKGIHYVARAAHFLNWIPLCMLLVVFFANRDGIAHYTQPVVHPWAGFALLVEIVVGYFATAGAAGADFGLDARGERDVFLGGFVGIALMIVLVGSLALLSVAGAIGNGALPPPGTASRYDFTTAIFSVGSLSGVVFFLYAAALLVPTAFAMFISANSFATMLPTTPRWASTTIAATVGVLLAVTGVAGNLIGFFGIVGGSFSPVCGAMAADFLLAKRMWLGPRLGVNWAGYIAWTLGCLVGMLNNVPGVPQSWKDADHPAAFYSFVVAFALYCLLTLFGARPAALGHIETNQKP